MKNKRGLFITFEGIDGCGKSTQLWELARNVEKRNKYFDFIRTHEPWRNEEIKKRLSEDKDAYSGALELAKLFVDESRVPHTREIIHPRIEEGYFVFSDRYAMSTCAYQSTQGANLLELIAMHRNKGILVPDMTVLVDTPVNVCAERMKLRGDPPEKFDNLEFMKKLRESYLSIASKAIQLEDDYSSLFGNVFIIDGNKSIKEVADAINKKFSDLYSNWGYNNLSELKQF